MTTATNIQMATNQATPTMANSKIKEAGKMTHDNNIQGPKSLVSNFIGTNRAILAGSAQAKSALSGGSHGLRFQDGANADVVPCVCFVVRHFLSRA